VGVVLSLSRTHTQTHTHQHTHEDEGAAHDGRRVGKGGGGDVGETGRDRERSRREGRGGRRGSGLEKSIKISSAASAGKSNKLYHLHLRFFGC